MSAQVIAIANNKGGVGKTALATNLGAAFARRGYRTLLVDYDSQANLTDAFLLPKQVEHSVGDALSEGKALPVLHLRENLYLAPSNVKTELLERREANTLRKALRPLRSRYDIILIDTPPSAGTLTTSALIAADKVIVPITAEPHSYKGLRALTKLISSLQRKANENLKLSAVVLCFYDDRLKLSKFIKETAEERFKELLCTSTIRRNIAVAESILSLTDVYSYNRRSKGAEDYEALTDELLNKLELIHK